MARRGRPAGTKTSDKNWISKGIRLSKEEWEKLDRIAERLSDELSIEVNNSAVVRKAIVEFIKRHDAEESNYGKINK
jgi:predicted transcriptional regulator